MRAEPELADDVVEGTVHQPLSVVGSGDVEDDGHMRLDVDYLKHIGWRRHDRGWHHHRRWKSRKRSSKSRGQARRGDCCPWAAEDSRWREANQDHTTLTDTMKEKL